MIKKIQSRWFIFLIPLGLFTLVWGMLQVMAATTRVECENMTLGGQYAGKISSPFSGVALYANNDYCATTINFTSSIHSFSVRGCSNNSSAARVDLKIGGITAGSLYFSGTTPTVQTLSNISHGTGNQEVRLTVTTDTGSWDAYVDYLEISDLGSTPTPTFRPSSTPTPTSRLLTPTPTQRVNVTPTPTMRVIVTPTPTPVTSGTTWVGTWGTSPQLTESSNMPPSPGLSNNTLRQIVRVSIGGGQVRLKFSNQYGTSPVVMNSVHLAVSTGGSSINTSTDQAVTFGGSQSVTMAAGQIVTSDTLNYNLSKQTNMAITIYFGSTSSALTGHPGSRTTSYIQTGNNVSASSMSSAVTTDHWYIITGIDVWTDSTFKAVVALGDSITDGRGSTTNGNDRWTDNLANRLLANTATSKVAVLNAGIGGNCVLTGGLGPTALTRFDRDVLGQSGARYLIILEGVNDIGGSSSQTVATDLINAYQQFITKAHASNILVFGATILPFGGSSYSSTLHEQARQTVNNWIKTSGQFDAIIDFDAALRDPNNQTNLLSTYDSGDHLHPNAAGYKKMADVIDLNLFTR